MTPRLKSQIVEYMGGKCVLCGYNRCLAALHCHHINPFEKTFAISEKTTFNQELRDELDKCLLLCSNCHIECHNHLIDHELLVELGER